MLTKVLLYGYCVGVFPSRKIERRLVKDVAFRVLAAGTQPDFRTISEFRRRHLDALEGLFVQVLRLARQAGALQIGRVAIDGRAVSRDRRNIVCKDVGDVEHVGVDECGGLEIVEGS